MTTARRGASFCAVATAWRSLRTRPSCRQHNRMRGSKRRVRISPRLLHRASCPNSRSQRSVSNEHDGQEVSTNGHGFRAGIDDVIIVPLVASAFAAESAARAALSISSSASWTHAFPLALQLARLPLFTLRIIGDGAVAAVKGIVACLPVAEKSREKWRVLIGQKWSWLRQQISYQRFEQAVHRAFEHAMEWVFRKCRNLTPRQALYVIAGAVLWLPFVWCRTRHPRIASGEAAALPPGCSFCIQSQPSLPRASSYFCRYIRQPGPRQRSIRSCRRLPEAIDVEDDFLHPEDGRSLQSDEACCRKAH